MTHDVTANKKAGKGPAGCKFYEIAIPPDNPGRL